MNGASRIEIFRGIISKTVLLAFIPKHVRVQKGKIMAGRILLGKYTPGE